MMKVINGVQFISLDVDANDWALIQGGLNELPRKLSEPVLQRLVKQVIAQQPQAAPPSAPLDEVAKAA